MAQPMLSCIDQVSSFLKVKAGKITFEDSMPTRTKNQTTQIGYINIISELVKESQAKTCVKLPKNDFEEGLIHQWLEYCILYVAHLNSQQNLKQIMSDLNKLLELKTFLVTYKMTIADIVLYYLLYNVMENLSPVEKELYVNVSRWFDNIQQDKSIRQSNKVVNFSSNYIINVAPSRNI